MNCSYCQTPLPNDNLCKNHDNYVRFIQGPQGDVLETQIYLTKKMPHRYVALAYYVDEFAIYEYDSMPQLIYHMNHIPEEITPDNTEQFIQRLFDLKAFL